MNQSITDEAMQH